VVAGLGVATGADVTLGHDGLVAARVLGASVCMVLGSAPLRPKVAPPVGLVAGAVGVAVVGVAVAVVGASASVAVGARGSHDVPLAGAVAAAAVPAAMAGVTPEAAVARTVPAISVTVAGPACAKRMKRPTSAARYCCGTTRSVWVWLHEACCPTVAAVYHLIGHQAPRPALPILMPLSRPRRSTHGPDQPASKRRHRES
jgi:hypothetical protein